MSTRQYIGARYVPKFASPIEWDNARSYEALEIVTYLGTSYTSKKSVPAGTAITNTEYWVVTGNYNAQVEAYREEVATLESNVEEYRGDVSTLESNVEAYREEVTALESDFDDLESDFDDLKENVHPINYKNIILIGDSYGTSNGGGVAISHPFPERVQDYLGLDNAHFRASFYNGYGFGNGGFYNLFNALAGSMTDEEKKDVTDIYFLGGWNDESTRVTQTQFNTGVQNCETLIASKFPNANKHIVFISHTTASSTLTALATTIGWYDGLIERGWIVDRNLRFVLVNPNWVISDGAHPNQDGVDALAKYFCDKVYCGQADVNYEFLLTASDFTLNEGVATNFASVGGYVKVNICNDETHFQIYTGSNAWIFSWQDSQSQPITHNLAFNGVANHLAAATNKIYGNYQNAEFPVNVAVYDNSGNSYDVDGTIGFYGGDLCFRPGYVFNSGMTGALTVASKYILIKGGTGSVQTRYL